MAVTDKTSIGSEVMSFEVSPQFNTYSGVEIIVSEDVTYFAGNRVNRVLTIENPWGTQEQAETILAALQANGFQYQPYTATGALLNPAAELGDGITISDTYSGIYSMSRIFSRLMTADIEAPQDEEVDHEYPYEPKQDRIYKREIAEAQAQIKVNAESIESEVLRATTAEDSLRSSITQTADEISANVVKKTGGNTSSFGWSLTDSAWSVSSNGSEVFRIDSSGATVKGVITATGGSIGGFTIESTKIYNGMNNLSSADNGVYIGTDGIAVGGGNFKVTSSGAVSSKNMTLTGTLTIGGSTITAAQLRSGAYSAYTNGTTWSTGAGYGYAYNNATTSQNYAPNYLYVKTLSATSVVASNSITTPKLTVGNFPLNRKLVSVKDSSGNNISLSLWVYA